MFHSVGEPFPFIKRIVLLSFLISGDRRCVVALWRDGGESLRQRGLLVLFF
jgi:hypothetical protein